MIIFLLESRFVLHVLNTQNLALDDLFFSNSLNISLSSPRSPFAFTRAFPITGASFCLFIKADWNNSLPQKGFVRQN